MGSLVGVGLTGLLVACQSSPGTVVVTPQRPTSEPPTVPPATGASPQASPAAAASPAASPVAAASPSPAPVAAASPSPAVAQPVAGRPMYQMDPRHTGRSPYAGPRQAVLRATFESAAFPTPDPGDPRPEIQSSAAIAPDGTIYIGNFPGRLFALADPAAGEQTLQVRWSFHPPGASSFHTTPALAADGTVYAGFSTGGATPEAKGTFYALRAPASGQDPQVVWTVDLGGGRQTSSPTLGPDGTIYAVSGNGKLFAVTPSGAVRWSAQTGPSLKAAPALGSDGTVYLSSMDGKLYAVAPPSGGGDAGTVRWTFDFGEHLGPTPLVTAPVPPPGANAIGSGASPTIGQDGTIYLGASNSNFYAIAPDGTMRWMFEAEREVAGIWSTAALSSDGSTLFFGANKGGLYALNARDGSLRWQFPIPGSVYASPTLDSRGTLYVASEIGHLFALDSSSGNAVFDFDAGNSIWTAPAIRPDGSLVIGDRLGRVLLLSSG